MTLTYYHVFISVYHVFIYSTNIVLIIRKILSNPNMFAIGSGIWNKRFKDYFRWRRRHVSTYLGPKHLPQSSNITDAVTVTKKYCSNNKNICIRLQPTIKFNNTGFLTKRRKGSDRVSTQITIWIMKASNYDCIYLIVMWLTALLILLLMNLLLHIKNKICNILPFTK